MPTTPSGRAFVTTALLAAGLAAGAVAVAVPAAADSGATQPPGNILYTPHFENHIAPWTGSSVSRILLGHKAPDGTVVARVGNHNGHVSIDDWPGEVKSTTGTRYTASVQVAATHSRDLNQPLTFVVREHGIHGPWVASAGTTTRLRWSFTQLSVSVVAKRTGDYIDVYAYQGGQLQGKSGFFMDSVYLYKSGSTPPPPPPPPPPGDAPSTLGLLAYDTGQPTALGNTSRYKYVVVQENQFSHIAEIKRMNPDTKVLAYMNTNVHYYSSCSDTTSPHLYGDSYGVNYCWANRYHPDWFLTDRAGSRLRLVDYSFAMPMDVGNPLFAATFAQGSYANLKEDGFDGIWIDDMNIEPGHGLDGRIAQYSDEQYGAATTKFGSTVGDYMRSHGMIAIANVGMAPWIPWQLSDTLELGKHLTAVNREHYVRYGDICGPFGERFNNTASNGTPPLSSFFNETKLLQAQGTKISGVDYGYTSSTSDDIATMTYGRAMFLLSWDGTAGSAYFFRRCGVNDTAAPQWTASIGLPTGPVQTDAGGILTRNFQHGIVVLNPNRGGSTAKVSVRAGLHTVSGATEDGGVYVAPQTAAILSS
jgi:hypothetical protein